MLSALSSFSKPVVTFASRALLCGAAAGLALPAAAEENPATAGAPAATKAAPALEAQTVMGVPAEGSELVPAADASAVRTPLTGAPPSGQGANELDNGLGAAGHDRQFQQLYASWEREAPGQAIEKSVSIPSGMPLATGRVSSGYGMRNHPVLRRRARHKGIDLAAPTGTPIYATADGVIERADWFSSYGLYISIDHGGALETRYAHMSRLAVTAGQEVSKGDVIGYVGSTGRSTGPHLHYEVRVDGEAVNPVPYMKEAAPQLALSPETASDKTAVGGGD
jgi:murein DD-endopeptidase MepM/ murein hydrolase activator NlpD